MKEYDVFVSYSTADMVTIDTIADYFEEQGLKCWISHRDARPGTNWDSALIDGIKSCKLFVLVLTKSAYKSAQVEGALRLAKEHGMKIMVFREDYPETNDGVLTISSDAEHFDASEGDLQDNVVKFFDVVKQSVYNLTKNTPNNISPPQVQKNTGCVATYTQEQATQAKFDVFVSYSPADSSIADAVVDCFEEENMTCWIGSRDISPNAKWSDAMKAGIESCEIFLLILTTNTGKSTQVKNDMNYAREQGKKIIIFRAEDAEPFGSISSNFAEELCFDASIGDFSDNIVKFSSVVRKVLEGGVNDLPPPASHAYPLDNKSVAICEDMQASKKYDVFVSHSSVDKEIVYVIVDCFEKRGIKCWVSYRDIPKGAEWATEIMTGISSCSVFLLVLTASSNASKHVKRELGHAENSGLSLVPLRMDNTEPNSSIKYYLDEVQFFDASSGNITDNMTRLSDDVRRILDEAPE